MKSVALQPAYWWLCPVCAMQNFLVARDDNDEPTLPKVQCPHCDTYFEATADDE